LEVEAERFASDPNNPDVVRKLTTLLKFVSALPFPVVLWEVQNIAYGPLIKTMDNLREQVQDENSPAKKSFDALAILRENLRINGL
jgi:F0F1-type ATP synthase membrane subunit b/b'